MKSFTSRILMTACATALSVAASGPALAQTEGNPIHAPMASALLDQLKTEGATNVRENENSFVQREGNTLSDASEVGVSLRGTVNHSWIAPAQDHTVRTNIGQRGQGMLANSSAFPRVQM